MSSNLRSSGLSRMRVALAATFIGVAIAGCNPGTPAATPEPTSTIAVPTTQSTDTVEVPTATSAPLPTDTVETAPSPTAEATATTAPAPNPADLEWKKVGLQGSNITDLALHAGGTNLVLAVGPKGSWLGSYAYAEWQPLGAKLDVEGRTSQGSIGSADVMYITSNTGCASGLPSTRSRSTDGGKTWKEMANEAMHVAAANSTIAYGATCSAVIKSTDSGATWSELASSTLTNFDIIDLATSPDGQTVYVAYVSEGGTGRIQSSTDAGKTWKEVTPKTSPGDELRAPGNLFYVTGSVGRPDDGGLYMTSDQGLWFLPLETTDWKLMKKETTQDAPGSGYFITALFVDTAYSADYDKQGPVIYTARAGAGAGGEQAATGQGVFRSINGGMTWESVGKGLEQRTINSLVVAPHDPSANAAMLETILAGTDDGIWSAVIPKQ